MRPNLLKILLSHILFIVIVSLTLLFPRQEAQADAKHSFIPRFSTYARYDTNFYLTDETFGKEREVYTYVLEPGIGYELETPKSKLQLNYSLPIYFYDDKSDVPAGERSADDDNYVGQIFNFDGTYNLFDRLLLMLNDEFELTRRPVESDRSGRAIARDKYWVNMLIPGIFYTFNERVQLGLRYRRLDLEYLDDESVQSEFHENRFLLNLLYNPNRKLTFDLDYQLWENTEDPVDLDDVSYTSNQIQLLAEKRFNQIALLGGIGYHNRSFDDSLLNQNLDDDDTLTYTAAITWQNPPPEDITRYRGRGFLKAKTHAYIAYDRNFSNLGYFFDTYVLDRGTISLSHVFLDTIRATVRGVYEVADYKNFIGTTPEGSRELRKDNYTDIAATIGYLIKKNMEVSFRSGIFNRDSNIAGFDFDNTYGKLTFDFNYDIFARGAYSEEASYYR